jgi:hypothetical protein
MNIDEIYTMLSVRITQEVVSHQTLDWNGYFTELRETVRRVVIDQAINPELSVDERIELARRLLAHVDELASAWPSLTLE